MAEGRTGFDPEHEAKPGGINAAAGGVPLEAGSEVEGFAVVGC